MKKRNKFSVGSRNLDSGVNKSLLLQSLLYIKIGFENVIFDRYC